MKARRQYLRPALWFSIGLSIIAGAGAPSRGEDAIVKTPNEKRAWGPEQAIGAPDTPGAADTHGRVSA